MDPKKDRRVKKIEVTTDTPTEYELGIQLLTYRGGKENRERGGAETTEGGEGGSHEGENYTLSRGGSGRKACKNLEE